MSEEVVFEGKIWEVVEIGDKKFEVARRAPGVRLIIVDRAKGQILLTREHRHELGGWDHRLPGGKVFDKLAEYSAFRKSGGDIVEAAKSKAKAEAREEAGVNIAELKLFDKSTLGATVEWDLYVFEVTDWHFSPDGQQLEDGENIDIHWFTYAEALDLILSGKMSEGRIALILLRWLQSR